MSHRTASRLYSIVCKRIRTLSSLICPDEPAIKAIHGDYPTGTQDGCGADPNEEIWAAAHRWLGCGRMTQEPEASLTRSARYKCSSPDCSIAPGLRYLKVDGWVNWTHDSRAADPVHD